MSGRWNSNQNFMNPALRHRLEVKNNDRQFWSPPRLGYYNARVGLVDAAYKACARGFALLGASEASEIIAKPHKVTQSVKQCSAVGVVGNLWEEI